MNWGLLLYVGFLHGNSNLGFKQSWKRKINAGRWGDGPVVDLSDTTGETARGNCGSVFFDFRTGLALCTGCHVSNKDRGPQRGGSVSFMALCSVTADAAFARWPVMDREAIQYTSFLVPFPRLSSPSYLPSEAVRENSIKSIIWTLKNINIHWVN